jgi:hypothetical protein
VTAADAEDAPQALPLAGACFDLELLRPAYRRLTTAYAEALGRAERVGRPLPGERPPADAPPEGAHWYLFGPLVRLLAGGHVRSKLRALAARCAQLEPALDPDRDATARSWLAEVRESSERTAAMLPSLRVPSVFVLVPFLLGLAPVAGKALDVGIPGWVWFALGAFAIGVSVAGFADLWTAFRHKRELLLPGAAAVDREPAAAQLKHTGVNAYRDENDLFALLGSGKRQEAQLDQLAFVLLMLFAIQASYLVGSVLGRSSSSIAWTAAGLAAVLSVVFIVVSSRAPKRVWR